MVTKLSFSNSGRVVLMSVAVSGLLLFSGCVPASTDGSAQQASPQPVSGQGEVYFADGSLFGVTDTNNGTGNGLELFDLYGNFVGAINEFGLVVAFDGTELGHCEAEANQSYNEYGVLVGKCNLSVNRPAELPAPVATQSGGTPPVNMPYNYNSGGGANVPPPPTGDSCEGVPNCTVVTVTVDDILNRPAYTGTGE